MLYIVIVQQLWEFFKRRVGRLRKNWRDFRKDLEKFVEKHCNKTRRSPNDGLS